MCLTWSLWREAAVWVESALQEGGNQTVDMKTVRNLRSVWEAAIGHGGRKGAGLSRAKDAWKTHMETYRFLRYLKNL